jgi:hypothetical protein
MGKGGFRGGGLDVRMLANEQSGGKLDLQRQGSSHFDRAQTRFRAPRVESR